MTPRRVPTARQKESDRDPASEERGPGSAQPASPLASNTSMGRILAGVAGSGGTLPYLDTIQASFGGHDVSGVHAHVGGAAAEASKSIGATAYATGDHVAFRDPPDLHTAAHEAAHVIQQRARVQLKNAAGKVGDSSERSADAAADAVVRGDSAEELLGGGVHSKKEGELLWNQDDPWATGLSEQQESLVNLFVAEVNLYLGTWRTTRTGAELTFLLDGAMMAAVSRFRGAFAAEPIEASYYATALAARRLRVGSNRQFVQEIRAFNPGKLGYFTELLDAEDIASEHSYAIEPILEGGVAVSSGAATFEHVVQRIRVHYTNAALGMSWKQVVELTGFKMGIGLKKKFAKGQGGTGGGPSGSASGDVASPGKPDPAVLEPENAYLPPSFFATAVYTPVGIAAKAQVQLGNATADVGYGNSALVIGDPGGITAEVLGQGRQLTWDPDWSWSRNVGTDLGGGLDFEVPSAEIGVGGTVGELSGELVGDAELVGDLGDEIAEVPDMAFAWVPMHVVRLYFQTGRAELWPHDLEVLADLITDIEIQNSLPGYGMKIKIEIAGSHSAKWGRYDRELKELDESETRGHLTPKEERRRQTLQEKKDEENEALARERAQNTREALHILIGTLKTSRVTQLRKSIKPPGVDKPLGSNPYGDLEDDRRVDIVVSHLAQITR